MFKQHRQPGTVAQQWPYAALVALAAFIWVGTLVAGDYAMGLDEWIQRQIGHEWLDHLLENAALQWAGPHPNRLYGIALEAPLALIERVLGLTDSRDIFVARHVLTHLFFLAGGFCAALLAHRLFGGGWLALFALAAFALHPRLHGHSFSNSKDAPFAALFMVCLYLTHRAFQRGTVGAFALLGVGVGVLVNLRVMGLLLVVLVLAARGLDAALASGWAARRHALATAVVFIAVALATLYAVSPYLWSDPLAFREALAFAAYPMSHTLLQGELVRWPEMPAHYIPTWMAVTTPPALLALGLAGAVAAVAGSGAPHRWLRDGPPRIALLLVACVVLAVLGVIAVGGHIFQGWRHVYFLWAPMSALAVLGLRWLAAAGRRPVQRRCVHALAGAGVFAGAVQLALLHPHQAIYFSWLVDRDTPERLRAWYAMDYWQVTYRQTLERALADHPTATAAGVGHRGAAQMDRQRLILTKALRRRIPKGPPAAADFVIGRARPSHSGWGLDWPSGYAAPVAHAIKTYGNTLAAAFALDPSVLGEAAARIHRAEHTTAAATLVAHSAFELHLHPRALTWLKVPCGPTDLHGEFTLSVRLMHGADQEFAFGFARRGMRLGNACMMNTPLPAGELAAIEAGQRLLNGPNLWRVAVDLSSAGAATDATRPAVHGGRVARGHFDLYVDGAGITYVREGCRPEDTWASFFLHVFPVDPAVLPAHRRASGFDNLDFEMQRHDHGLIERFQGRCIASVQLPDHPIERLRTGQLDGLRGVAWTATLNRPVRLR